MMHIIIILSVITFFVFMFVLYERSFVLTEIPLFTPREYKVLKITEEDCDGELETRYYPMEKVIFWENIWFIHPENYYPKYEILCTKTLQEALNVLKYRQNLVGTKKEIKIEEKEF